MQKFTFLDNTANFVLYSYFVETHHPSPWLSNTLFERLFLPEKVTNYKTSTVVSHKHVLNGGYYNRRFCIAQQYPAFTLVDYPLYV